MCIWAGCAGELNSDAATWRSNVGVLNVTRRQQRYLSHSFSRFPPETLRHNTQSPADAFFFCSSSISSEIGSCISCSIRAAASLRPLSQLAPARPQLGKTRQLQQLLRWQLPQPSHSKPTNRQTSVSEIGLSADARTAYRAYHAPYFPACLTFWPRSLLGHVLVDHALDVLLREVAIVVGVELGTNDKHMVSDV